MDPWSFGSEGKGLLFPDEMDFPVDAFSRGRKALMEWEIKPSYGFENGGFVSREAAESVEFMELGFTDIMRKHFHANPSEEIYGGGGGGEVGCDSSKRVASPTFMITPNSSFGEVESGWKLTGSVVECNIHDSSLIDLKLGRLADGNDANTKFSKERSVLSSGGSTLAAAAKRARTTSSYSQAVFCQVQGCNMDLSSSKDYHKRHKVCDAHSKTSRVIVNGIEQRFCQQCSRFHLLTEFDDGKRSCRKRLAGHNERRRKPQLDSFSGKSHKFLQSIQGTRFLGTSLPKRTPFVFPDILPGSILYEDKYGEANQCCHIKFEKESIYNPQLAVPMMNNAPLLGKSFPRLHNIGKQHCSGNIPLDTASNVQELSGASNSSCALSLLSTQSQDFSSYSTGIPVGSTLIFPGGHVDHVASQFSERPLRMSSVEKYAANGFYSSATNPIDVDQMGSMMLSDVTHAVDHFEVHATEGMYQGSGFSNSKHSLSPEHGTTVDLLQLSSHLQRVERQRSSLPVKQENEDLCYFLTT